MLYRLAWIAVTIPAVGGCTDPVDLGVTVGVDATAGALSTDDATAGAPSIVDAADEGLQPLDDGGGPRGRRFDGGSPPCGCTDPAACARLRNGSCMQNGAVCSYARDCCSFGCTNGKCGPDLCAVAGDPCTVAGDCCSSRCVKQGVKQVCVSTGTCLQSEEACSLDGGATCCSGRDNCVDGRCDVGDAGGCRDLDSPCLSDNDCCGPSNTLGFANAIQCIPTGDAGTKRCTSTCPRQP